MAIATGHGILSKQKRDNEMSYTDRWKNGYEAAAEARAEIARLREEIKFAYLAQRYAESTAGLAWATVALQASEIANLKVSVEHLQGGIDAAGINSIHNACQFRTDCRKANAEIARLRENAEMLSIEKGQLKESLASAEAELGR